jgi:hypothetical protein
MHRSACLSQAVARGCLCQLLRFVYNACARRLMERRCHAYAALWSGGDGIAQSVCQPGYAHASSVPEPGVLAVPATPDLARMPALAARATAVTASLQRSRLPSYSFLASIQTRRGHKIRLWPTSGSARPTRRMASRCATKSFNRAQPAWAICRLVSPAQAATNSTLIILVDLDSGRAVDAQSMPNSQPEVPKALVDLAV